MNSEENLEEAQKKKFDIISSISRWFPSVEKPTYRQSFNTRMKWTGIALIIYIVLSYITVYGVAPATYQQFRFFEIVLGSKFGSLMTLGIGPIVTAGIILQLLVGSKILKWDTTKPEYRKKFQSWNKGLAIIFAFLEAIAFVLAGAIQVTGGPGILAFVIFQLALGGIIVIFLDDLVTKWGFGSGISLFIAAGVATQIFIGIFSPFATTCQPLDLASCIPSTTNPPAGRLWVSLISLFAGDLPSFSVSFLPIVTTAIIFIIVIYAQHIKINIPLAFAALKGFGRTWSLKLLYTSNIPVILAAAMIANIQLMGRFGLQPNEFGLLCGPLGCYDQQGNPTSGMAYYLSAPRTLLINIINQNLVPTEILRAIIYLIILTALATMFSVFWVNTAGMDAKSVAEQLSSVGMQIPGYRRDPRIIESVLNRYIPPLAVLGGLLVGLLAASADILDVIGTGTGILLTVMIIYNYYEELSNQKLEEAHPIIRKILGG
ncbi:MAG: preprotein translocase subunit SecY [Candidatus Aenigmatarchaeota archaeon]